MPAGCPARPTTAGILAHMPPDAVPPEIRAIADARSDARRERDWATADRLKGELEAAGWKVIDAASLYTLERAAPPDVEVGGSVRYGSTASVPSRLDDAPVGVATVVIVATDDVAGAIRQAAAIADGSPDGTQVVIVANAPSDGDGDALAALDRLDAADPGAPGVATEVVRTATRVGAAAAWNAGLRRAAAPVVVLARARDRRAGERSLPAIVAALEDPSVAVAGPVGLVSDDLRSFRAAPPTRSMSTRSPATRSASAARTRPPAGCSTSTSWPPTTSPRGGASSSATRPTTTTRTPSRAGPCRCRSSSGTPACREADDDADPARARLAKRNFYRFLKRFATRRDLIGSAARGDD